MEHKDYRLAAIMFTDIVGFSRMMGEDEAGTLELLRYHNQVITEAAARRHGTVIKTIGDAFLVDFRSTVDALRCAMEIQDAFYAHNKEPGAKTFLLRIGVHLGDIYFFENDALGEGINIASRLQSMARPGCICFSQDVYNQVLNKIEFRAEKLGKVSLKNISKEVHAYEIASANIEFDPDHGKPRPGFKPGLPDVVDPSAEAKPAMNGALMDEIRQSILDDIRAAGKRPTVEEALARYGGRGVEATEVISAMADTGFIIKKKAFAQMLSSPDGAPSASSPGGSELSKTISRTVEDVLKAIETGVNAFQESGKKTARGGQDGLEGTARRSQEKFERAAASISLALGKAGGKLSEKERIAAEMKRHSQEVGTGKWDKDLKDSDYFKPGPEEIETDFQRYSDKVEAKAQKSISGFLGNLISFLGVNALLWFINLRSSGGFLWAAIVTAAWGIGVVSNAAALVRSRRKVAELERMPNLEGESLDIYKKLNRVRDSMAMHTASVLTVPTLLFTINLLTSKGFLWAIIPSGIMALNYLGHLASYPMTKTGLRNKLFRLLGVGSWRELFSMGKRRREAGKEAGAYAHIYTEAAAARDDIVKAIKQGTAIEDFGSDMIPTLDRYVEQVKLLTHSVNEIDGIVATIPIQDLVRDREALQAKEEAATSATMKAEYRRSIEEIAHQEKACRDLEDQREVLKLRLGSSVNALKQLKMDLARLKALPENGEQRAIEDIRRKATDLTAYLEDLKVGYEESIRDPFEELERLTADADAKKYLPGQAEEPGSGSDGPR